MVAARHFSTRREFNKFSYVTLKCTNALHLLPINNGGRKVGYGTVADSKGSPCSCLPHVIC